MLSRTHAGCRYARTTLRPAVSASSASRRRWLGVRGLSKLVASKPSAYDSNLFGAELYADGSSKDGCFLDTIRRRSSHNPGDDGLRGRGARGLCTSRGDSAQTSAIEQALLRLVNGELLNPIRYGVKAPTSQYRMIFAKRSGGGTCDFRLRSRCGSLACAIPCGTRAWRTPGARDQRSRPQRDRTLSTR